MCLLEESATKDIRRQCHTADLVSLNGGENCEQKTKVLVSAIEHFHVYTAYSIVLRIVTNLLVAVDHRPGIPEYKHILQLSYQPGL